jgi:hypothetical protein
MVYSDKQVMENQRQIQLLLGELVGRINTNLVLSGWEEGRFGMAYETGTNRLELWGLGNSVRVEIN